jgi:anthranilate synthase/aminodeoxychorismate synthase-like glutamine amidotransferase
MILVIDNYDSFVHNLSRYLRELGWATRVVRNDGLDLDQIAAMNPSHIVISPGPCTPHEAGISVAAVKRFGPSVPILGVCLGHQCIGQAYGGRVVRALRPMHGKASRIRHDGSGLFDRLPNPLRATRYHSLVVSQSDLPGRHRIHPVFGVQFHPEAILTEEGYALLRNFLDGPDREAVA